MSARIFKAVLDAIKTRSPDQLIFENVDPDDFTHVLEGLRHRTNYLKEHSFRIHWFSSDKTLKVVMPSKLYECTASWLIDMITEARVQGLILEVWRHTMDVISSPEYNNFIGEFKGSVKEADLTFVPRVGPGKDIFPIPEHPQQNPSISLDEFNAGDCPPTMGPAATIPLDLAMLRLVAARYIRERGHQPAE